jgi:hypothetical protein
LDALEMRKHFKKFEKFMEDTEEKAWAWVDNQRDQVTRTGRRIQSGAKNVRDLTGPRA